MHEINNIKILLYKISFVSVLGNGIRGPETPFLLGHIVFLIFNPLLTSKFDTTDFSN